MDQPSAPVRTALYRFYAAGEKLLYVGITKRLGGRWADHARQQPWWPLVDYQTAHWFPTRKDAHAAELEAIAAESPVFNIVGAPRKGWVLDEETGFYVGPKRVPLPRPSADLPSGYPGDGWHWPHEHLVRDIKEAIASGKYAPGSRLPTLLKLAAEAGVSKSTVQNALAVLREQGVIFTVDRLGVFVTPAGEPPGS